MKNFLPVMMATAALGCVVCGNAAEAEIQPRLSAPAAVSVSPASLEVGPNQIWYGYYKGDEPIAGLGVGIPNTVQTVNNAIYIDGKDPVYQGKTIKGLRFRIQGKGDIDDVRGWLSAELNVPADEDLLVSVSVDNEAIQDTVWTEVALPEGFLIPEEGVYAGYSLHTNSAIRTSQFPAFTTSDRIAPPGALYNFETGFMSGWQSYGDRMGKLCYQVLLEGDFYENAVTVSDFGKYYVVSGSEVTVTVPAINMGKNGVSDIDYVIESDGVTSEEKHLVLDSTYDIFGGSFSLSIPLSADDRTRLFDKKIVITKVNGVVNQSSESVSNGELVTLLSKVDRTAVAETYTGTWCGWCPRAIVGNARLKEVFGDRFIFIEAHVGMYDDVDPMEIPAYAELANPMIGYPTSFFNREVHGDPYAGESREEAFMSPELVEMILEGVAEGNVKVAATWANDDKTRISVKSDVTLMYDIDDVHYAIAYVVKANGLSGDTPEWLQTNYFTYFAEDPQYASDTELGIDFAFYLESPEYITDMKYDDVAVAAYGLAEGLPNSVTGPVTAGETKVSEYTISIANNTLISDKENLKIVSMLIDTESGRIVNVDECNVSSETGVNNVYSASSSVETGRYDLTGTPVNDGYRGVVIVTYSDGTACKMIVK